MFCIESVLFKRRLRTKDGPVNAIKSCLSAVFMRTLREAQICRNFIHLRPDVALKIPLLLPPPPPPPQWKTPSVHLKVCTLATTNIPGKYSADDLKLWWCCLAPVCRHALPSPRSSSSTVQDLARTRAVKKKRKKEKNVILRLQRNEKWM